MHERGKPLHLTAVQLKVLAAVEDISERGWAPTYREILERLGWSPKSKGSLHQVLRALTELGLVAGSGRSLRVLRQEGQNDRSDEVSPTRNRSGTTPLDDGGAAAERRRPRHGRSLGRERTGVRPTRRIPETRGPREEVEAIQKNWVDPAGELPDVKALFQAILRAFRRAPRHNLPPAEHITWWDRGVRDGIETAMVYGEEAVRAIAEAVRAGDLEQVRFYAAVFETIFATDDLPRRPDQRLDRTSLIVDSEQLVIPLAGPNPRLLDALTAAASAALGQPGRKVGTSPAEYLLAHPDNVVLFRASVCVHPPLKIWDGDVDLTLDETKLHELASKLDRQVYVLHADPRHVDEEDGERSLEGAVYVANPDGTCVVGAELEVGEDGLLHPKAR